MTDKNQALVSACRCNSSCVCVCEVQVNPNSIHHASYHVFFLPFGLAVVSKMWILFSGKYSTESVLSAIPAEYTSS
jgi:hypothetical protein